MPKQKLFYSIYISSFDYKASIASLQYLIRKTPNFYQNGKTTSIICGFKIDEEGVYDSFSISSFVYSIHEMIKNQKIDVPFDFIEMSKVKQKIIEDL